MKKLLLILLSALSLTAFAQDVKKVAILETVDRAGDVPYGVKLQVRMNLTYAISNTPGYEGYDRVDMASIMGEQNFQRTGMVSDAQIKKLGEMTGAQYVLIAEAALYDAQNIIITAKVLDVETGGVSNSAPPAFAGKDPEKMQEACVSLARKLLGGRSSSSTSYSSYSSSSRSYGANQDFVENAWNINMKMIWVEGGVFMMGCTNEQSADCNSVEENVHRVELDGFYIGMLEVTQSQWEKVVGTNIYSQQYKVGASRTCGVGSDYPMYYVSWEEAMEFCRLLSNKTGKTYTLPTEAQWEYAARGGTKADGAKYAGNHMVDLVAWYAGNSDGSTHPCGSKSPNALGIFDMCGNVFEWCKDWYKSGYESHDTNNPTGPLSGSHRVLRGGCWFRDASSCRVAFRYRRSPGDRGSGVGFRVVLLP